MHTARLILRAWRDEDRAPFAAMSADPAVMATLGGVLMAPELADAFIDAAQAHIEAHGFGLWAVERREDGMFLGAVGLAPIQEKLPLPRGHEAAWRLARAAWGFGYASEAARAAIADGQARGLGRILAFTSRANIRSQAVMARVGLSRLAELDFDHPALPPGHPQRPHLVWSASETLSEAPSDRS
jgi:ribosomal-protein-alanine N-acetyltransferase